MRHPNEVETQQAAGATPDAHPFDRDHAVQAGSQAPAFTARLVYPEKAGRRVSRWQAAGARAELYWSTLWGPGVIAQTCSTATMFMVGVLFVIDAVLLLPWSVFYSIRGEK
jgi:hypothetical protein